VADRNKICSAYVMGERYAIVTMSGPFEAQAFKVEGMIFHENPSNRRAGSADREVCF
jgi:hypothetical protein